MMIQLDAVRWVFVGCFVLTHRLHGNVLLFFCVWIFQHYSWLLQLNILQWNYLKGRFRIMWCRNHDINTSQHVFRTFSLIKNNIWFLNNITAQNNKQLICRSFFRHVNEWAKRITSNYFQKVKCWFDKLVWVIKMK